MPSSLLGFTISTDTILRLATCSGKTLEAIGRNTRLLLDVAGQLKQIMRAIEAIPLHLTLDIVRLDDALGESWALPLQACRTWESFCDLLQSVVYARDPPGAHRIAMKYFVLTMAKTGFELRQPDWERAIKPGLHIEQAMLISEVDSSAIACAECSSSVSLGASKDQHGNLW
ncbi:hypothetical protein ACMFMG_006517 [Clarireedia jacksonii]